MKSRILPLLFLFSFVQALGAVESLEGILRESKWDRLIGTWVDADTKGLRHRVTYEWKFPGKVIEINSLEGDKKSVSLMGVNPKAQKVFHVGVDDKGGSSIGEWQIDEQQAVLGVLFITAEGKEGGLRLIHRLEDGDAMTVTVDSPEPRSLKLVRLQ